MVKGGKLRTIFLSAAFTVCLGVCLLLFISPASAQTVVTAGGGKWVSVSSPTDQAINSVGIVSRSDAWAVADAGEILHWDGDAWTVITRTVANSVTFDLNWVGVVSGTAKSEAWAVGANSSTVLHYVNGPWPVGQWITESLSGSGALEDAILSSATDGWMVGDSGRVMRLQGTSWSAVSSTVSVGLHDVELGSSSSDVWIVGNSGVILHGSGGTFSQIASGVQAGLFGIWPPRNGSPGWIVGDKDASGSVILKSDATGQSWTRVLPSPLETHLWSLWMSTPGNGWATGNGGNLLHYDGASWSVVASGIIPTPLYALTMRGSPATDGWLVGGLDSTGHGAIFRWVPNQTLLPLVMK